MSSQTFIRQPEGIPVGGQFASRNREESQSVSLGGPAGTSAAAATGAVPAEAEARVHPAAERNREALKDLVEEIVHEYRGRMTLVLTEAGSEPSLRMHRLKDDSGYSHSLEDADSLWNAAASIDTSDPSWPNGVAEPITLEDGRAAWSIDLAEAARTLL